ncbi:MAG: hypothetical protein KDD55_13220, partial [Bdellovibrionales bacterium]|nr:hypothetical protein [Bdellovibrionales bacterium]
MFRFSLLFFVLSVFVQLDVVAQENHESSPPQKQEVIELSQVISEIEKSQELLRKAQADAQSFNEDAIRATQTELVGSVAEHKKEFNALLKREPKRLSLDDLITLENALVEDQSNLESFKDTIAKRVEALSSKRVKLVKSLELWKNSSRALHQETSSLTRKQIRDLQRDLSSTISLIEKEVKDLLTLQSESTTDTPELSGLLERLSNEKSSFRSSLLSRDNDPLYAAEFWQGLFSLPFGEMRKVYEAQRENIETYLDTHQHLLSFHVLLLFLLTWIIFKSKDYEFIQQSFPKLYDNPFLLSITVALLSSFLLYREADESFTHVLGILCVFPLVLVFRDLLDKQYTAILVGIGVLYLLDQGRSLLRDFSEIGTLLLFAELITSFFLARHFVRECNAVIAQEEKPSLLLWLFQRAGIVASYLFLVSSLFLFGGYSRLITYLSNNFFFAIYSALFLFVAHHLLVGFLSALLHLRFVDVIR